MDRYDDLRTEQLATLAGQLRARRHDLLGGPRPLPQRARPHRAPTQRAGATPGVGHMATAAGGLAGVGRHPRWLAVPILAGKSPAWLAGNVGLLNVGALAQVGNLAQDITRNLSFAAAMKDSAAFGLAGIASEVDVSGLRKPVRDLTAFSSSRSLRGNSATLSIATSMPKVGFVEALPRLGIVGSLRFGISPDALAGIARLPTLASVITASVSGWPHQILRAESERWRSRLGVGLAGRGVVRPLAYDLRGSLGAASVSMSALTASLSRVTLAADPSQRIIGQALGGVAFANLHRVTGLAAGGFLGPLAAGPVADGLTSLRLSVADSLRAFGRFPAPSRLMQARCIGCW